MSAELRTRKFDNLEHVVLEKVTQKDFLDVHWKSPSESISYDNTKDIQAVIVGQKFFG